MTSIFFGEWMDTDEVNLNAGNLIHTSRNGEVMGDLKLYKKKKEGCCLYRNLQAETTKGFKI